jgi:sucrose-6-phosphate hydrolase SacC (GH32 family)
LRADERRLRDVAISAAAPLVLPDIAGDTLELSLVLRPGKATRLGLCVYTDQDGRGGLPITFAIAERSLRIGEIAAPLTLALGEDLALRVFLDKECVEVFANDRQAMIARHAPTAGRSRVGLISEGASATAVEVVAWRMQSIYQ